MSAGKHLSLGFLLGSLSIEVGLHFHDLLLIAIHPDCSALHPSFFPWPSTSILAHLTRLCSRAWLGRTCLLSLISNSRRHSGLLHRLVFVHEITLEAQLANVFRNLRLLAIKRHQVLRVGQVELGLLKLGLRNELFQVDLGWLDEPEVLVLAGILVHQWG